MKPKLVWDSPEQRLYEDGIDRGVLYLNDGSAIPWNGLISVDRESKIDSNALYYDSINYFNAPSISASSWNLKAFTYPPEFSECEGWVSLGNGMSEDTSIPNTFNLSYRTLIADSWGGEDFAYRLHLLYNLTAIPSDLTHTTNTPNPNPSEFGWTIVSVPTSDSGDLYQPTSYVYFDSSEVDPTVLETLETQLYGSDTVTPSFPTLDFLLSLPTL